MFNPLLLSYWRACYLNIKDRAFLNFVFENITEISLWNAKIVVVSKIDNFNLFRKIFTPTIKIIKYVFIQFRDKISVATLQLLYCSQLMQYYVVALRWRFELDEVRQLL